MDLFAALIHSWCHPAPLRTLEQGLHGPDGLLVLRLMRARLASLLHRWAYRIEGHKAQHRAAESFASSGTWVKPDWQAQRYREYFADGEGAP